MNNGITAAIYASFVLALGEAAIKKSYRDFAPSVAFFFVALLGLVIWIPLGLALGGSFAHFLVVLPYALASAVLSEALYFYALSKGQLSITAIILASYPIYTIGFSFVINHERLSGAEWAFVIMAIAGTLMSYLPSKLTRAELKRSGALLWPLVASVAAGFSDTISKSVINRTSSFDFLLTLAIVQLPVALLYLKFEKQHLKPVARAVVKQPSNYFHAITGGILSTIGVALLWISFNYTLASVASPIVATSGALIVLIATLFLDERMHWKNALGVGLIFVSVMGLSSVT